VKARKVTFLYLGKFLGSIFSRGKLSGSAG
jgi:hypothetical protein